MDDMHVHQERAVTSYALACSTKFTGEQSNIGLCMLCMSRDAAYRQLDYINQVLRTSDSA